MDNNETALLCASKAMVWADPLWAANVRLIPSYAVFALHRNLSLYCSLLSGAAVVPDSNKEMKRKKKKKKR